MKAIAVLIVLAVIVGGLWYWMGKDALAEGQTFTIAFGKPEPQGALMHIVISGAVANVVPPQGDTRYNYVWQQWADGQFELRDQAGKPVKLTYRNESKLISTGGAGFLEGTVRPGKVYRLQWFHGGKHPARCVGEVHVPDSATQVDVRLKQQ